MVAKLLNMAPVIYAPSNTVVFFLLFLHLWVVCGPCREWLRHGGCAARLAGGSGGTHTHTAYFQAMATAWVGGHSTDLTHLFIAPVHALLGAPSGLYIDCAPIKVDPAWVRPCCFVTALVCV